MTNFIFANDVNTSLAGPVSSSATTLTLASTNGLPSSVPDGYVLVITLRDQSTRQKTEIIYASSISGATLNGLARGQEGTSALNWITGDYAYSGPTAAQMAWVQSGRLIAIQQFETHGTFTYTPTPGMNKVIAYVQGAGGATGGVSSASSTQFSISGGASSGALAIGQFTASQIGLSQSITVGQGGAAGPSGDSLGGNGGSSSLGTLMVANGGYGTQGYGPNSSTVFATPGAGAQNPATATGGNILNISGNPGALSIGGITMGPTGEANAIGGPGGGSPICGGGIGPGAGADGVAIVGTSETAGNPGYDGTIIIYEYA